MARRGGGSPVSQIKFGSRMYEHDASWREQRRRRWMRANAHLYVRPDACRFMPPGAPRHVGRDAVKYFWPDPEGELPRSSAIDDSAEADDIIAARARERQLLAEYQELLKLKSDLLWLRIELKLRQLLREGKYSPDQPRVPAGHTEGGQWTADGGGGGITDRRVLSDESPDPIKPGARYAAAAKGHHRVPRAVFENEKYSFRPDTLKEFEDQITGPLNDPSSNRYDRLHREYNLAVEEALDRYLERNEITSDQMTPEDVRRFTDELKQSRDLRIRNFILRMILLESIRRYRGPGRRE